MREQMGRQQKKWRDVKALVKGDCQHHKPEGWQIGLLKLRMYC